MLNLSLIPSQSLMVRFLRIRGDLLK